ncbi:unnamed protein product [Kluyveromyces dobzhanskii CBS 2104]|uniref:WGS project CCBQ000000000 data, contig 00017 n=1 Tax=Kluyveromyces dobzhanskii CBS 2104 TaxID=1427455 RepID=A0A0A8L8H7_9SACH|nr:unnamed protein product [Kluyveromyces dobzhanskii CBS 2104]
MSAGLRERYTAQSAVSSPTKDATLEKKQQTRARSRTGSSSKHNFQPISMVDRYSVLLSTVLLALLFVCNSYYPRYAKKFIHLQYEYPEIPGKYDIGIDDGYIVITFIVILCLVRSFLLEFVLKPIGRNRFQMTSVKALQRFGEQGWSMIYYLFSWSFGFCLYYQSPYFFNVDHIYIGWPHDQLSWLFKTYYLSQIASWFHQIIVLNVEERRKDFWQMFAHHIITVILTTGSYCYYFTRIGNVILILMDIVDVLLSFAKMLKYCGYSTLCDYMFVVFLFWWVMLRHVVYNYLTYQTWIKTSTLMTDALCVEGVTQKRCWTPTIINIFIALLAGLQVITCIWMYLILKVLVKVVKGVGAEDVRSDEEEDEE